MSNHFLKFVFTVFIILIITSIAVFLGYKFYGSRSYNIDSSQINRSYKIDSSLMPQAVTNRLTDAGFVDYKHKISVNHDNTHPIAWFLYKDEAMAGFSFNVDTKQKVVEINIYINPSVKEDLITNQVNRSYITGLLFAAEYLDPIYNEDYGKVQLEGQKVYENAVKDNKLPIKE